MDDFYVYTWTRPDTGNVFYVGKGRGNRDAIPKVHNPIFISIVAKLKSSGLEPSINRIHENLTEAEAFKLERDEISARGRINKKTGLLANLTDGGEGSSGAIATDQRKSRVSKSLRLHYEDPDNRSKMSDLIVRRYQENPEMRVKTSAALVKRYEDPAEREKTAESLRGKPKSENHIASVSLALKESWDGNVKRRSRHRSLTLKRPPNKANKSGYKGVSFDLSSGKWLAQIEVEGRNKHLGRHPSPKDAGRAYDFGAIKYYGYDVYLNFPDEHKAANDNELIAADRLTNL
jgi:hypothetical protein